MLVNQQRGSLALAETYLSIISWWPEQRPYMQPAGLQQNPLTIRVATSTTQNMCVCVCVCVRVWCVCARAYVWVLCKCMYVHVQVCA